MVAVRQDFPVGKVGYEILAHFHRQIHSASKHVQSRKVSKSVSRVGAWTFVITLALTCILSPGERILAIVFSGWQMTVRLIQSRVFPKTRQRFLPLFSLAQRMGEGGRRLDEGRQGKTIL